MPEPSKFQHWISERLESRRIGGSLRRLKTYEGVDFCSNDYLGLAGKPLNSEPLPQSGATGSRLISGQSDYVSRIEAEIAEFHGFESGLLFSSGYSANMGVISALADRNTLILSDELIHASLIDGILLSRANKLRFAHNDAADLRAKLKQHSGEYERIFVVTETVFSMDGDIAPLTEIASICEHYGAALIVDEAHSVGLYGPRGAGLVSQLGLQNKVAAVIYTFGKAPGYHGAVVCGSKALQDYLINFCRPFIYTTAPSPQTVSDIAAVYKRFAVAQDERANLKEKISYFRDKLSGLGGPAFLDSHTPIQGIIIPGNEACRHAAAHLQNNGFAVKAILSPTVAKGEERLRICLHAHNSFAEIDGLLASLGNSFETLNSQAAQ